MIVTSEELLRAVRRSASARRRPTNEDGSHGRLLAERARGGGKCRASPSAESWAMRTLSGCPGTLCRPTGSTSTAAGARSAVADEPRIWPPWARSARLEASVNAATW